MQKVCKYCRSRQEGSNEYFFAKSASMQPRASLSKFGCDLERNLKFGGFGISDFKIKFVIIC